MSEQFEGTVIRAPEKIKIKKWRIRENYPVSHSQVILLYETFNENEEGNEATVSAATTTTSTLVQKLKANNVGVVKKRLFKDGDIVPKGYVFYINLHLIIDF